MFLYAAKFIQASKDLISIYKYMECVEFYTMLFTQDIFAKFEVLSNQFERHKIKNLGVGINIFSSF